MAQKRTSIFTSKYFNQPQSKPQEAAIDSLQDQIQEIEDHRIKRTKEGYLSHAQIELLQKPLVDVPNSELQFLVKWVRSDQRTWQPGQNLKNAPQFLESYKRFYSERMSMSSLKPEAKKRGRKPKNATPANSEKSRGPRGRGFNFARVYKDSSNLKVNNEDELEIIDKEAYIKGTREPPVLHEEQKKPTRDEAARLDIKELRSEPDKEQDGKGKSPVFRWEKQKNQRSGRLKSKREKVNEEMRSMGLFGHHHEKEEMDEGARNKVPRRHQDHKTILNQSEKDQYPIINNELQDKHFINEGENQPLPDQHQEAVLQPQANMRSFMNTQEQRYHVEPEQFYPAQYDEMPEDYCQQDEYFIGSNASSQEDILDLFVRGRRNQDKSQEINHAEQKERCQPSFVEVGIFLNEGSKSAQPVDEEKCNPSIEENPYKRGLSNVAQSEEAESITKKIKPNEGAEQAEKKTVVTINLIDEDSPLQSIKSSASKKSLKQQIRKQLQSLLDNGANEISEQRPQEGTNALQIFQPVWQENHMSVPKIHCASCQRQEEETNQLRQLFNELLEQDQINLDALFLQQETFSVLSSLNPSSPCNSQKFLRSEKMTDISDNSTLRLLISRKIALIDSVPVIISDYSLKKLIKMGEEWIGIFQINSLSNDQARMGHFKYVQATDLLQRWRGLIVDFLMR